MTTTETTTNTEETAATTPKTKAKGEKAKSAPKSETKGEAKSDKAAPKSDAKTTPDLPDYGVKYSFAKTTSVAAPKIAMSNIVISDFDSRAASAEPDEAFIADIKANGVLVPVSLAPLEGGNYLLVAGRRRFKAAKKLGFTEIPAAPIVYTDDEKTGLSAREKAELVCLAENAQREGLNAWDLAVQMRRFRDVFGWTQTQIAKHLNRKDAYVSQYLSFFDLDKRVQQIVRQAAQTDSGVISKARLLKAIKDPEIQLETARACFDKATPWTVQQLNDVVESIRNREQQKAERAAAKDKEKGEKKTRKSSDADDEEETNEEEESEFASASVALKIAEVRKLADLVLTRYSKRRDEFAEAAAKDKPSVEVKLAYERGALDTIKVLLGQKAPPKSIVND